MPSLLASEPEPKAEPGCVDPNADACLPLLAVPLKAPNPNPLAGLEAAPNAADGVEAAEPNVGAWPNADGEPIDGVFAPKAEV